MELNKSKITIIIPTLNEEEGIGRVIDEVRSYGYHNIIVVDGGSTDRTVEIAKSKGAKVIFQDGRGKAKAISTALKHVKTPFALIMDGDFTYPAKYIDQIYNKLLEGYDEVIGARKWGSKTQGFLFRVGNKILTKFFNLLMGTNLSDVLSGMYAIKMNSVNDALFETDGFSIGSEIAAHIASMSRRITEVPIKYRKRLGEKKLKVRHGLLIALDMLRLSWRYNPAFTIFAIGALLLIPGLLLGAWVAYQYFFFGVKHAFKGILAVLLTLAGFQSLMMALIAIYVKRIELRLNRRILDVLEKLGTR